LGALIAPHAANALWWTGRHVASLSFLREVPLHRVATRCLMVVGLLGLIPMLKWMGMADRRALGLEAGGWGWREFAKGWGGGAAVLALLVGVAVGSGAYQSKGLPGTAMAASALTLVGAGLVVGVVEELFFRGVIHGGVRDALGVTGAALLSSVLYALAHFAQPEPPLEPVYGHWYEGLRLLRYSFAGFTTDPDVFPMVVTLFVVGMGFSLLYEKRGNLFILMGIHGGWVWVLQWTVEHFRHDPERAGFWFGTSSYLAKSYTALLASIVFVLVVLKMPARGGARGGAGER